MQCHSLIFLASILLVQIILAKIRSSAGLPPSPRALPIIGHLHLLGRIPHQAFHKLSTRYGPLVYFFIGSKPCLLASSPEVAKEILKINEANFLNRPKVANLDYLTYGSADFATIYYGPHWKCAERKRFLTLVLRRAEAKEAVDVGGELMRLTNNIISRMLLRTRCSDTENEADDGFEKRLKDARDRYDSMMERIMKEHEDARRKKREIGDEGDTVKDVLDILLDIYEDENAEKRLTRENIKAFLMNIFGAGTDTSSITVEWGLAELINHPTVMEKARQEIESVVGRSRLVQESDVANLPYLQAIVKETLRLHPTGPLIVRESLEDCTIAGYRIPAKTRLAHSLVCIPVCQALSIFGNLVIDVET
ncbi:CYTOCHROME P450 [Salix viminalis]|uniref:CYTOCHROME P450 n=1 Tax=Salix viminalis TaxID=40686 RepID=A0A9Q0V659_SALVM|nr:CYTOCHROME P450 [Salix viminalis]